MNFRTQQIFESVKISLCEQPCCPCPGQNSGTNQRSGSMGGRMGSNRPSPEQARQMRADRRQQEQQQRNDNLVKRYGGSNEANEIKRLGLTPDQVNALPSNSDPVARAKALQTISVRQSNEKSAQNRANFANTPLGQDAARQRAEIEKREAVKQAEIAAAQQKNKSITDARKRGEDPQDERGIPIYASDDLNRFKDPRWLNDAQKKQKEEIMNRGKKPA